MYKEVQTFDIEYVANGGNHYDVYIMLSVLTYRYRRNNLQSGDSDETLLKKPPLSPADTLSVTNMSLTSGDEEVGEGAEGLKRTRRSESQISIESATHVYAADRITVYYNHQVAPTGSRARSPSDGSADENQMQTPTPSASLPSSESPSSDNAINLPTPTQATGEKGDITTTGV
jgi:hypothetical protein